MSIGGWGASPVEAPKPSIAGLVVGLVLFLVGSTAAGILGMVLFMQAVPAAMTGSTVYASDSGSNTLSVTTFGQKGVWISPYVPASCVIEASMLGGMLPLDTSVAGSQTVEGYTLLGTFRPGMGFVDVDCTSDGEAFTYRIEPVNWASGYTGLITGLVLAGVCTVVGIALAISTGVKMAQANRQPGAVPPMPHMPSAPH